MDTPALYKVLRDMADGTAFDNACVELAALKKRLEEAEQVINGFAPFGDADFAELQYGVDGSSMDEIDLKDELRAAAEWMKQK